MSEPEARSSSDPLLKASPPLKSAQRRRVLHGLAWTAGSILVLLLVLVAGLSWYTTTADFQHRVGDEVVHVLEDATGGRVELGHISFSLWHLAIEADNLVIHGTEGPGEMPYLSAGKIFVRVRIYTFLSHTVGKGPQSHIGVNYLRVEEPHLHLIVDKNGMTNQPVPKHPTTSNEPVQDTLLDLQAGEVELVNGLAVINDRAIPFDAAAKDLNAEVHYIGTTDRYGMTIDLADLRTRMANEPEVQSKLHMAGEFGRDMARLTSFDFETSRNSRLNATALIEHFAHPEWQASLKGTLAVKQIGLLTGVDGLENGTLDLNVQGRNCTVSPQVAQKHPHFWQRRRRHGAAGEKMLPPSPECAAGYLVVGKMRLHQAAYRDPYVRVQGVDATADLHVTPAELLFTALTGTLPGGGRVDGELKIENWLGEAPSTMAARSATTVAAANTANTAAKGIHAKAPVQSLTIKQLPRARAYMTVTVKGITLRTIMDITAPVHYGDLGLDTAINGPVKVEWGGPAVDISSSVQVDANLHLTPTGERRHGAKENVPVSGVVIAHYEGRSEVVNIQSVDVHTPATTLAVRGVLGVNNGDPLTSLQVNLQTGDLGEFDQTLQTLGFEANGKRGSAAIPVDLHGTMGFAGTAKGAVRTLHVKGHLEANNLGLHFGSEADIHIDSVVGDAEYAPDTGLAIASSTIKRNTAVLNVTGAFRPHRVVSRRGVVSYVWDDDMGVDATAKLANAQAADLLEIAGQQGKVRLTGTANIDAHASGTLRSLSGSGNLTLTNGEVYGEPYQTIAVDVSAQGTQINATRLLVQAHDMAIHGSAGYNLANKHIAAHITGNDLRLSKLQFIEHANPNADAVLTLNVDANGTVEEPNLHAQLQLADITVQGKPLGELNLTASSAGSTLSYQLQSKLIGAQVAGSGKTSLVGDYETQARLTLAGLDIANAMPFFAAGTINASSQIAGVITVEGPAAKPQQLAATAELTSFEIDVQKAVKLQSEGPIRASLRNGVATLDQFHVAGSGSDLQASGSAQIFGDSNPQGGKLNVKANGEINLRLAHTLDPNLNTSGRVTLDMGVQGRVKQPSLTGTVKFDNANIAIDNIPNGLSSLTGTMAFNENRLEVRDVTAMSGGGKIKLGGFIAYQKGLFADLTANIDTVRVRLYGLSTTANGNLRLQGGPPGLLLSGNVLITRFGIGPDVDFAAFTSAAGVPTPPSPNSLMNKIRMDVHVTSAPQLDFQNSYAKLAGTVDLSIRGTIAQPSVLGTIRITDGSATFAGTKYELDRGTIYFSNPVRIDPTIDLDVSTRVENYDITIGIHGDVSHLKPTYRSSPPLTEADIFNLLALGRTQEEAQINSQQEQQAGEDPTSSALLGGALNATVSNRVSKLFGAGSIKIDPAFVGTLGNSTARITVQEPLSKQITLVFATNVNQSAQQLIQVQYQINEDTSIVATRDESGVFSIVYKIRQRYR